LTAALSASYMGTRMIQPYIQYRINKAPGSDPESNHDELVVELHFFFF